MSVLIRMSGIALLAFSLSLSSCDRANEDNEEMQGTPEAPLFLLIDEESIDNGNEPNNFSANQVNDQLARVGLRQPLEYFQNNTGKTIDLFTGQVGDEGWFAIKTIPASWRTAGPTSNGARNFLQAGPGLGSGTGGGDDNKEILLDEIPDITPLRATGLAMLTGSTVLAIVYDSEISVNYSPLKGNLMGANLGIVAFDVLRVRERTEGSSSSLPSVTVRIRNVTEISASALQLFSNAPVPPSSSEPFDIIPPGDVNAVVANPAQ